MGTVGITLLSILGVLVILLGAAAIHALTIKAKRVPDKSAISFTEEEKRKYAETLSALIRVPSISHEPNQSLEVFDTLHKVMAERFPLVHEKLELHEFEGSRLYIWRGKNPDLQPIVLMGHQDVVPAEELNWQHPPFSGVILGDLINGRGAMDCKCTLTAELCAVEELLSDGFVPERDVYISTSNDEEASGNGTKMIVEYLKSKGIRTASALDEGGAILKGVLPGMNSESAMIGVVEKGFMDVKLTAKGHGGHSSTPRKNNPMARLCAFVNYMEKHKPFRLYMAKPVREMFTDLAPYLSFPMRFLFGNLWLFRPLATQLMPIVSPYGRALLSTTFVCTMCGGSSASNVIPDAAYVVCNLRPALHQACDESLEIIKRIAKRFDLEVEVLLSHSPSPVTDTNGEAFAYLASCVRACFPNVGTAPYYMCGGTDCGRYADVTDCCLRFAAIRMTPEQVAAMHSANESIGVTALAESVKFYKYYIINHP